MKEAITKSGCINIFRSEEPGEMTRQFTSLWAIVINNQELNSDIATVKNNVLHVDDHDI